MDKKVWQNPTAYAELENAEVPLWFWNDKLEKDELLRQLKLQTEKGITSNIPHVRMNNGHGYIGGFLDEEWFEKIRLVLAYKKQNKEKMWLYDEIDWPSGTCNRTVTKDEEFREQYLDIRKIERSSKEIFRMQVKGITKQNLLFVHDIEMLKQVPINIYLVDSETNTIVDPYQYIYCSDFGPELEIEGNVQIVIYEVNVRVDTYAGGGDQQVNYMNRHATEKFIELSYEPYVEQVGEYLGNTINASFNDETRMCNPLPWSHEFADEFFKRKGYSIYPVLIELILSGERAGRTRCDYYDVVAALYQENYFRTLQQWCKNHGIMFCAHLLGEETMHGHTRFSGDYLRQNRYMDIPGADHLGKGIGSLNLKFTSAGAHSYGKDMVAVEIYGGSGHDLTYQEYIRMATWAFQNGMKIIVNHGLFYSLRGDRINDWPPSQFFQWDGWEHMKQANEMIRRLHYALTGGRSEEQILVYYPLESFWLHHLPDLNYTYAYDGGPITRSERAADIDQGVQLLLNYLLEENKGYELIHNDAVDNYTVEGNKITNTLMGQTFEILILPYCEVLSIKTVSLFCEYANNGGKVILYGNSPKYATEKTADDQLLLKVKELLDYQSVSYLPNACKEELLKLIDDEMSQPMKIIRGINRNTNNRPAYERRLQDPYIHHGEDLSGVAYIHYRKNEMRNTLIVNYNSEETEIVVEIESLNQPTLWDTFTGEIKEPITNKMVGSKYQCTLILPAGYGVILQTTV